MQKISAGASNFALRKSSDSADTRYMTTAEKIKAARQAAKLAQFLADRAAREAAAAATKAGV